MSIESKLNNDKTELDPHLKKIENYKQEVEKKISFEEKLIFSIEFMREALSQKKETDFKSFWEAKRFCLPFFKENIHPVMRTRLWGEFVELSDEAKKLKDLLEEESIFAVEQLELAIKAVDEEIASYDQKMALINFDFSDFPNFLKPYLEDYRSLQKELNLLNAFASRINSLRKEIIKTEMRFRFKSKFLKTLSLDGDKVFPKRKQLIKMISQKFIENVDLFCKTYFDENFKTEPFFQLKEEIKSLQNLAKILTLNTKAFTDTRLKLSGCWDKIKFLESEKRKISDEKKIELKNNKDKISQKILSLKQRCADLSIFDAEKENNEILKEIKEMELNKSDVISLKTELKEALKPIQEKKEREKEEIKRKTQERINKFENLKSNMDSLINSSSDIEILIKEKDLLINEADLLSLNKIERQIFDRSLKNLKDIIAEKKEKQMLDLPKDKLEALEKMKEILNVRISRREEIRKQLEYYRKALGSSGLDFEKAINFRELMDLEKERLEKINESILEIEDKIAQI